MSKKAPKIKTGGVIQAAHLKSIVERVERLEGERKTIGGDIREVYDEAKGVGYNPKIIRKLIAERARDEAERAAEAAEMDLYRHALGMAVEAVRSGELSLREAGRKYNVSKSSVHRGLTVPAPSHDPETGELSETGENGEASHLGTRQEATSDCDLIAATSPLGASEREASAPTKSETAVTVPPGSDGGTAENEAASAPVAAEPITLATMTCVDGSDCLDVRCDLEGCQKSCGGRGVAADAHDNPPPRGPEPSAGAGHDQQTQTVAVRRDRDAPDVGNVAESESDPESAPRPTPPQDPINTYKEQFEAYREQLEPSQTKPVAMPGDDMPPIPDFLRRVA